MAERDLNIVQQELALDSYLRTMLEQIPVDLEEPAARTDSQQAVERVDQVVREDRSQSLLENQSIAVATAQTKQALSVMPDWTQQEFQALFFKIDTLVLAVPLTDLLRTIRIERKFTKIPGQPSWFLGLLDNHDLRVGVLDTGQLVFGKRRGGMRNLEESPFSSLLISRDGRWGLACDEVLSIGRLQPDQVRWRTMRKKRSWLVGTVIDELIAIVDIQKLVPHRKSG